MTSASRHVPDDGDGLPLWQVAEARGRVAGVVRPVVVDLIEDFSRAPRTDRGLDLPAGTRVWAALEFRQHTGSFKARGAWNFLAAHRESAPLPAAGIAIASGGNAGLACAWAASRAGVPATVYLPTTAPAVKLARLRALGATIVQRGVTYADASAACSEEAPSRGALLSHAYDDVLVAAGAGTLVEEIRATVESVSDIVVAVGGGGLFSGVAVAGQAHGIRTHAVEPRDCRALHAALDAGRPVPVECHSVAADALGSTRASAMAVATAASTDARSLLVSEAAVTRMRHWLWESRRLVVEHAAAVALAGVEQLEPAGRDVVVVLCGANTDPADLAGAPAEERA